MAFKSYLSTPTSDGGWQLTQPTPLRLSGPQGLVARHLAALASGGRTRWSLADTDCLRLLPPEPLGNRWILFEQVEADELRLSRLHRIQGLVTGGQTELLLLLSPLQLRRGPSPRVVTVPTGGRAWSEELALDGAPDRAGAPWTWCERALHVGAAVLGGR